MRLNDAQLCLDCETVFEGRVCPACASEANWPLRLLLDKTRRPQRELEFQATDADLPQGCWDDSAEKESA